MWNAPPFYGWLISIIVAMSMSIPFWYFWTVCHIGNKFFYWLPKAYLNIGFWNCVALFIVISILKAVLIPRGLLYSNSTTVANDKKDKKEVPPATKYRNIN